MKYSIALAFAALMIATHSFADRQAVPNNEMAVAQGAGIEVQAPSALHLMIVGNGFQLNWTLSAHDPEVVTGYEIVRADRFPGPYDVVATVVRGTSQYVDTTASHEVIYFYKVRAITGSGHSEFSNTVSGER